MRLRNIVDDDSAVSPVIGVILMVAITVILAAVIASFVLGLGPSEAAPQAQFEFEEVSSTGTYNIDSGAGGSTIVEITHTSGDKIQAQYLQVAGDASGSWETDAGYGGTSEIGSGDSITVENLNSDWELSVVWESGDQSSEIASESS